MSYQFFDGVDLFAIPGVSHSTVLTIMSELEENGFKKFNTAKQFTSWLRLAPNNKISGGKMLSHRAPKWNGRLKIALSKEPSTKKVFLKPRRALRCYAVLFAEII